ncbi:hypothetical protein [Kineococcus aurantiacus]|uniref:hypothetical protein n=1 Tax=Kineococcus aurantiacus TaxID=37633 RepID=UPI0031D3DB93
MGVAAGAAAAGSANATATPAATVAATPADSTRDGARRGELAVSFSNADPENGDDSTLKSAAAAAEVFISCSLSCSFS